QPEAGAGPGQQPVGGEDGGEEEDELRGIEQHGAPLPCPADRGGVIPREGGEKQEEVRRGRFGVRGCSPALVSLAVRPAPARRSPTRQRGAGNPSLARRAATVMGEAKRYESGDASPHSKPRQCRPSTRSTTQ